MPSFFRSRHESQPGNVEPDDFEARFEQLQQYYRQALTDIVAMYSRSTPEISQEHNQGIDRWLKGETAAEETLEPILERPRQRLEKEGAVCHADTNRIISQAGTAFADLLSPADQIVWRQVQTNTNVYGAGSPQAIQALKQASSSQAREAMQRLLFQD